MKRLGSFGALLVAAGLGAVMVNAALASPSAMLLEAGWAFCAMAKPLYGLGTDLLKLPPTKIKAAYAVFKKDRPGAIAAAPASIKRDLKKVLAFDSMLFKDLSKHGWNVSRLPHSVLTKLAVDGPKLKPASDKVIGYLDAHCGMHLRKP
jgi:hypothetical protein